MQRKEISHTHALQVDWTEEQSNDDVRLPHPALCGRHAHRQIRDSLRQRDLPSSCSMAMAVIMVTGYPWLEYFLSRCVAMCSCCRTEGVYPRPYRVVSILILFFFFLLDSYGHSEGSPSEAGKLPTITG